MFNKWKDHCHGEEDNSHTCEYSFSNKAESNSRIPIYKMQLITNGILELLNLSAISNKMLEIGTIGNMKFSLCLLLASGVHLESRPIVDGPAMEWYSSANALPFE